MKFSGQHKYEVPSHQVFRAILDPTVLQSCIPGCSSMTFPDADHMDMHVTTPLPGLRGPYRVVIQITKRQEPSALTLDVHRKVFGGSMVGVVRITITEEANGSLLAYSVTGNVTGPLSFMINSLSEGIVKNLFTTFFTNVGRAFKDRVYTEGPIDEIYQEAVEKTEQPGVPEPSEIERQGEDGQHGRNRAIELQYLKESGCQAYCEKLAALLNSQDPVASAHFSEEPEYLSIGEGSSLEIIWYARTKDSGWGTGYDLLNFRVVAKADGTLVFDGESKCMRTVTRDEWRTNKQVIDDALEYVFRNPEVRRAF